MPDHTHLKCMGKFVSSIGVSPDAKIQIHTSTAKILLFKESCILGDKGFWVLTSFPNTVFAVKNHALLELSLYTIS